jgi:hypothetical protein
MAVLLHAERGTWRYRPVKLTHHGHTVAMRCLPSDDAVRAAASRLRTDLAADGLGKAVDFYFTASAFAGMTFSDLGRNPRDEITADDLLAVSLLDITWRPQVVRIVLGSQHRELSSMLAAIPGDLDLWNADDGVAKRIDVLWDALMAIDGIGTASATKLLARKRPRLCPISDSVVVKAVRVPGRTWDVLRCLLQDPAARAELEALRPAAAAEASLLRILDVVLWTSHSESAAAQWVRSEAGMAHDHASSSAELQRGNEVVRQAGRVGPRTDEKASPAVLL